MNDQPKKYRTDRRGMQPRIDRARLWEMWIGDEPIEKIMAELSCTRGGVYYALRTIPEYQEYRANEAKAAEK